MGESKVVWYEPDDPGMVFSYFLLAMPAAGPPWIVLGHCTTEDDEWRYRYSTEDDEWVECTDKESAKFLKDKAVRLAEEKGLGSGTILMVASQECVLETQLSE
jgi:hypothetical protein